MNDIIPGNHEIINESAILHSLSKSGHENAKARDILAKARELKGLDYDDIPPLAAASDPSIIEEIFETARYVKESIYGKRLVLFAPLYISNLCANECLYCAFRARNREVKRRALTQDEIARETQILTAQGHKRVLLVAGESYPKEGFNYILKSIDTVYRSGKAPGEIRRVNVNIAPLEVDEFKQLKQAKIGTYQLFQETYHRETYAAMHLGGKKRDYDWRVTAMDRAFTAGIDDVGIGVLFGLHDWRFEILALMQHIRYLEKNFGVGPHTISMPRLEPAVGSNVSLTPPYPVSDLDFKKLIAILRLAVPYTGMILSTRETPEMRREAFSLGISQISAGSRTNPGGYSEDEQYDAAQFSLGDHRPLDEVIRDISSLGYVPSFCTGCYRLGRTGKDFMDLAKPGEIKKHCDPNAASTFMEYLRDYASPETLSAGIKALDGFVAAMDPATAQRTEAMIKKVKNGQSDIYC